jgi:hypothetical protein
MSPEVIELTQKNAQPAWARSVEDSRWLAELFAK